MITQKQARNKIPFRAAWNYALANDWNWQMSASTGFYKKATRGPPRGSRLGGPRPTLQFAALRPATRSSVHGRAASGPGNI